MTLFQMILFGVLGFSVTLAIINCIRAKSRLDLVLGLDYLGLVCLGLLLLLSGYFRTEAFYDVAVLLSGIGFFASWVCSKHVSTSEGD